MDKYDAQIAELTRNPDEIKRQWFLGEGLFQFASPDGTLCGTCTYGCLTMIRDSVGYVAATPGLTKAIRADERIPRRYEDITVEHLPVFAEWQRRLDKELGR